MQNRQCVCGKPIAWRKTLCHNCAKEHGNDRGKWPLWLREWTRSVQNEINAKRRHDTYQIFEEMVEHDINPPKWETQTAIDNLNRAQRHPEMDFEEFGWFCQ